jgi:hypothetical protein
MVYPVNENKKQKKKKQIKAAKTRGARDHQLENKNTPSTTQSIQAQPGQMARMPQRDRTLTA